MFKRLVFFSCAVVLSLVSASPSLANVRTITVRNTTPVCAVVTAYAVHNGKRSELYSMSIESGASATIAVGGIQRAWIHAQMKTGTCHGSYYSGLSAGYETETTDDHVKIVEANRLVHIVRS